MLVVCSAVAPSSRSRVHAADWVARLGSSGGIEALRASHVADLAVFQTHGMTDESKVERTEQLAQRKRNRDDSLESLPPRPQRLPVGVPAAVAHQTDVPFSHALRRGQVSQLDHGRIGVSSFSRSSPEGSMRVVQLDHLVLTVKDVAATVAFYTAVLGMRSVTFGDGRTALHFGGQKLNLHPTSRVLDPNVKHATPGSADVCFLVDEPIENWMKHLARHGCAVILGPVERTGARGQLRSIYLYDPDENLIELSNLLDA